MKLVKIYDAYSEQNKNYMDFIEQLTATDFAMLVPEVISFELASFKESFEKLMEEVMALEGEPSREEDMKDLKYLLMDSLFLANDLSYFYKSNELGRFKMRVINAVNKRKRAELFNETPAMKKSCVMEQQ